jgi:hypothetical protein
LSQIRQANAVRPHLRARVTGHGPRRLLAYRIKPEPGQTVSFAERDAGHITRVLGRVHGSRGTIAFTARPGHGRREVVAELAERGVPVQSLTVARYTPPTPRRLTRVRRLRVQRTGTTATVAYSAVRGAVGYEVSVMMRDGARKLYRTTRHQIALGGLFLEVRSGLRACAGQRRRHAERPAGARRRPIGDPPPQTPQADPTPTTLT